MDADRRYLWNEGCGPRDGSHRGLIRFRDEAGIQINAPLVQSPRKAGLGRPGPPNGMIY